MKQTAVEWLVEQLNKQGFAKVVTDEEIKQAKEMEKEQICNAYRVGWINYFPKTDSEQYYNETFKS
jgi:predicted GNAT family acetyltransferase